MITIDELRGERRAVCLAKTLLELRDALITARDGLREYNDRLCYTRSHHEVKIDEWIDLTELKTFGGVEPKDTAGIWSWDDKHLLVGDDGEWDIKTRSEYARE